MALSRRRVLTFGLGGAAILACGGGLGWFTAGYAVGPDDVPIALTVKELAIVRAIVEALHPADGDLPAGVSLAVHQRIDEEVWSTTEAVRADLKAALVVLEHLPPLFGWPGRLTRLAPAEREAVLVHAIRHGPGPVVQAVFAIKQMCSLFYFGHPETWAALRYDGPWVAEKPPPSSVRYAELVRAARGSR